MTELCGGRIKNYSADHPAKLLGEINSDIIAGISLSVIDDPEALDSMFEIFFSAMEPTIEAKLAAYMESTHKIEDELTEAEYMAVLDSVADKFLAVMVNLQMQSQNLPEIMGIVKDNHVHSDFNVSVENNYELSDFNRQWDHLRTAVGAMLSLEEITDTEGEIELSYKADTADEDISLEQVEVLAERFIQSLDDNIDQTIIRLRMNGLTEEQIARELGYHSQSAISKRIRKIRAEFEKNFMPAV